MIQIQDDSTNQSVVQTQPTPVVTPVDPTRQAALTDQAVGENTKNNAAEIDKLLAELDKLSKNLEEKPAESVAPTPATPLTSSSTPTSQVTAAPTAPAPASESDKFDFDSFLTDLEKKINEEAKRNPDTSSANNIIDKSAEANEDFRKNRSNADLGSSEPEEIETKSDAVSTGAPSPDSLVADQAVDQNNSEELRAQNIFEMLGLMNISDEDKNQFLDELETMIWDDFVVHDLELLLTSEEYKEARQILDTDKDENQKKEDLIIYLEKLIPDLDEVLYEKALELKSEMMGERLGKMKENADEATLAKIKEAEDLISQNLWRQAATLLNS